MMAGVLDWILHLDTHLAALAAAHGAWVYLILFGVIFIETGVVVLPFLPGDSLLFVSGALAAGGACQIAILFPVLAAAAIGGDTLNYAAGAYLRRHAIDTDRIKLIKPQHIERTQTFFRQHGSKTIVLARFVPIVRTMAPFVAALGSMPYRTFLAYNVAGGIAWVGALLAAGYLFGNLPWIGDHLSLVLLGIVAVSLLPGIIGWARHRKT